MRKPTLDVGKLQMEARRFADLESSHDEPSLFGVTDGKAVGTYLELKFREYLCHRYSFAQGNAASGIDFPDIEVDLKVTSIKQPQSSCPFRSARQKVFGLGYGLLVLVYAKVDNPRSQTARLSIEHVVYIDSSATGDYTLTKRLREMVADQANEEDIAAFLHDRNLPADDIEIARIAAAVLSTPPQQGFLTISNALQWRLQYGHAVRDAGTVPNVRRL
jgi:hypothetical protein